MWIAACRIGICSDTRYPERYSFYGYDHGLEDVFIRAVQEDVNGEIWISTNNGISHWDEQRSLITMITVTEFRWETLLRDRLAAGGRRYIVFRFIERYLSF